MNPNLDMNDIDISKEQFNKIKSDGNNSDQSDFQYCMESEGE